MYLIPRNRISSREGNSLSVTREISRQLLDPKSVDRTPSMLLQDKTNLQQTKIHSLAKQSGQ
jgi:hypothetical protein